MELLIIKSGKDYIRVKDEAFTVCGLDKASVFHIHKLDRVNQHLMTLKEQGLSQVSIYKLTLTEEPFEIDNHSL